MSFRIDGWPEGHPNLTRIDGYPFGLAHLTCPNPVTHKERDGYASSFRRLYNSYKRRAAKQGLEFTLTEKDFYELTSQPCYFCASPPSRRADKKAKNSYVYNGLDRLDSTKGYIPSNCCGCCWEHNDLKGRLAFTNFYRHSLAVVLSVLSKTALDIGDLEGLERLIELFPNVRFLKEHRLALLNDLDKNPRRLRFNWQLKPVRPSTSRQLQQHKR